MRTTWQDLRYSARLLLKHPGFTLTAVGVLTLGIGVNAGIFGIINGLMIRPLAGADAPGEVVLLGWGLRAAIYQISPLDPVTLGAATGILAIASLGASIIPARRAANVLPMIALRNG